MIFWILVALLAGGLGVALARPLLRGAGEGGSVRAAYDMQVYRDQLGEIERDRARGVLTDDQAAAARLEVERRLLAAGEDAKHDVAKSGGTAPLLAAGVAAAVPVAAIAVYATLGWPGVPGYPLAQRLDRAPTTVAQLAQAAQGGSQPQSSNAADPHPAGGGSTESMAQLTDRLAKRLEANPGDAEGWSLLARSYQQLNRHREAVGALERAVTLTNREPQMVATLGEARIMAADGSVIPQARAEFEEVLKAEPKDPRSRFYIAVAETQAGNMQKGLDQLVSIARDATPDAPYLPMLRERIGALANELKRDPAKLLATLPKPVEPAAAPASQAQAPAQPRQERGPTAADVQAAQQMSPQDRQQMIQGMIDGLAARLEADPKDVEGWLRLIRAHKVQNDDAKATDAVAKAVAANPDQRPRIVQTAQQLGVTLPTMQAAPTPAPPPVAQPAAPMQAAAPRGPTAADVQAAQQMSPQDRQQMIRGMVDGLAARMEQNPTDVEGWLRLIRAYKVLGDDAKAVEAAGKASSANPAAMPQIVALSNQLGLAAAPAPVQAAAAPRPLDAQTIRSGTSSGDAAPFRQRLAANPNDREALWQVGLAEVAAGNKFEAVELWGRLLGQFDPASAEYTALRERLDTLKRGG